MENQYFYLNGDGHVEGPFWLSVMRDLWKAGKLRMSTEISLTGTDNWQPIEYHPEIFETQARMPVPDGMARGKSSPVRLLVWTVLLFLAYMTYVIVHWNDGKRLRFGTEEHSPSAAAER
jgi:hypothetical protein